MVHDDFISAENCALAHVVGANENHNVIQLYLYRSISDAPEVLDDKLLQLRRL